MIVDEKLYSILTTVILINGLHQLKTVMDFFLFSEFLMTKTLSYMFAVVHTIVVSINFVSTITIFFSTCQHGSSRGQLLWIFTQGVASIK